MCLIADTCLTAGPGVMSLNPTGPHTFVKIDHETFSMVILLPSADSRRVVVSDRREYVHEVLVSYLFKLGLDKNVTR